MTQPLTQRAYEAARNRHYGVTGNPVAFYTFEEWVAEMQARRNAYAAQQDRAHAQRYLNSRANFPFQLR